MQVENMRFSQLERLEAEIHAELNARLLNLADQGLTDLNTIRAYY